MPDTQVTYSDRDLFLSDATCNGIKFWPHLIDPNLGRAARHTKQIVAALDVADHAPD